MRFPKLVFPLTVDFGSTGYWINDEGPFQYGAAVTEFFCGDNLVEKAEDVGDGLLLMRRLEELLQVFGGHLHPYAQKWEVSQGPFSWLEEMSVESSVSFVGRPTDGNGNGMAERWTVSGLRDFLCLELGKAIEHGTLHGNAGCADVGSSTSRGIRRCTVSVLRPVRRKRLAGR